MLQKKYILKLIMLYFLIGSGSLRKKIRLHHWFLSNVTKAIKYKLFFCSKFFAFLLRNAFLCLKIVCLVFSMYI